MKIKEQLYNFCKSYIEDRISRIQKQIKGIQESLTSETKSSAGDKHETGRAMLQLEREKLGQQLLEAEKMKQMLSKVIVNSNSSIVAPGSWVTTNNNSFFIAISAGETIVDTTKVYCISPNTPIGKLLIGKKEGDSFTFNAVSHQLLKVE